MNQIKSVKVKRSVLKKGENFKVF